MLDSNKEELRKEMDAIGSLNQLEGDHVENWRKAMVRCGKRMYSLYSLLCFIISKAKDS